jgi:hypothetical protein
MPYTTPPTFVGGVALAADELNVLGEDIEDLNGRLEGLTFSGVQVSRSTNQSIPTSSDTLLSWTTENLDYGAWWSSGTTVTVPAGAIPAGFTTIAVDVTAQVRFGANGTGKRRVTLLKNGSSFGSWKISALDDDNTDLIVPDTVVVAAGDELTVQVWQNSGGGLNVTAAKFTVERRAPVA